MNLSQTIIPKSDQLNADDLITGPRTIKITAVEAGSAEQPVSIHYEGENGRPYKPSKSMRRILVAAWGPDGDAYVGRRLTLYRDPEIKFGGDPVGGIRISHASGISRPIEFALTLKRGQRKPYRVEPLPDEHPATPARDLQTLSDIAEAKINEGRAALESWAATLTPAEKKLIGLERFNAWKARAA